MTGTPTYKSWKNMRKRCKSHPRYAGRGITFCERWNRFENFLADMGQCPAGQTLDREDNDGNYEPGNCSWATKKTQANNRSTSRRITANGITRTLAEWEAVTGVRQTRIRQRIDRDKWTPEAAVGTPDRMLAGRK